MIGLESRHLIDLITRGKASRLAAGGFTAMARA
jgi:hypothetical protein